MTEEQRQYLESFGLYKIQAKYGPYFGYALETSGWAEFPEGVKPEDVTFYAMSQGLSIDQIVHADEKTKQELIEGSKILEEERKNDPAAWLTRVFRVQQNLLKETIPNYSELNEADAEEKDYFIEENGDVRDLTEEEKAAEKIRAEKAKRNLETSWAKISLITGLSKSIESGLKDYTGKNPKYRDEVRKLYGSDKRFGEYYLKTGAVLRGVMGAGLGESRAALGLYQAAGNRRSEISDLEMSPDEKLYEMAVLFQQSCSAANNVEGKSVDEAFESISAENKQKLINFNSDTYEKVKRSVGRTNPEFGIYGIERPLMEMMDAKFKDRQLSELRIVTDYFENEKLIMGVPLKSAAEPVSAYINPGNLSDITTGMEEEQKQLLSDLENSMTDISKKLHDMTGTFKPYGAEYGELLALTDGLKDRKNLSVADLDNVISAFDKYLEHKQPELETKNGNVSDLKGIGAKRYATISELRDLYGAERDRLAVKSLKHLANAYAEKSIANDNGRLKDSAITECLKDTQRKMLSMGVVKVDQKGFKALEGWRKELADTAASLYTAQAYWEKGKSPKDAGDFTRRQEELSTLLVKGSKNMESMLYKASSDSSGKALSDLFVNTLRASAPERRSVRSNQEPVAVAENAKSGPAMSN